MRITAARLSAHGQPLKVETVVVPAPGPGDVLVDMLFAGVNPVDRYNVMGRVGAEGPLPRTVGVEGVGRIGGRIVLVHGHGLGTGRDGLWSSSAVVPDDALIDLPDGVPADRAAAMGVAGVTAWRTVTELARVTADDHLLVLGASGGVGSMAVSVGRSLGATVWGQTGNRSKAEWIRGLGAEQALVCGAGELAGALGDFGPTVVIDPLGGAFTGPVIEAMRPRGRLVIFGASAGEVGPIPLQSFYRKGLTMLGYAGLIESDETMKKGIRSALQALADGRLNVEIDTVMPLEKVNEAFDRLEGRSVKGKIVLELGA